MKIKDLACEIICGGRKPSREKHCGNKRSIKWMGDYNTFKLLKRREVNSEANKIYINIEG